MYPVFSAECAFSVVVFLAILLYFPAKPPTAPSVSANTTRLSYKAGFKTLLRLVCSWQNSLLWLLYSSIYIAPFNSHRQTETRHQHCYLHWKFH